MRTMHIQEIRSKAPFEEIDYVFLKSVLKEYAQPRNKIQSLLKSKDLIRIKKGLYVFGPKAKRIPYCKESLANLIYGPSAISLEYALGFYGLIPERVEEISSITPRRHKEFTTPLGRFSYDHLHPKRYALGITQLEFPNNHFVLFATQEKALCDTLVLKCPLFRNKNNLEKFLLEDMRLEHEHLPKFDKKLIEKITKEYNHSNLYLLSDYLYGEHHANRR